jgi:hypothetical protein
VLYQKRPQRRKLVASSESAAVAFDPPMCSKWSVEFADGTPAKHTWSKGRDYDEPCRHVVAVTTALLVDSGMLKGKEV